MSYAVLKGAGYVLAHVPDMVIHNGTTQTTERITNPESDYLKKIHSSLRSYEQALHYAPNQVYIGNMTPEELKEIPLPWYEREVKAGGRFGRFGEIMPEDEFIGLMQVVDAFDLVNLTEEFSEHVREKLSSHELLSEYAAKIKPGGKLTDIESLVHASGAEALLFN